MSSCHDETLNSLLKWINHERKHMTQTWPICQFQQLYESSFVYELLNCLDSKYFTQLSQLRFHFDEYIGRLEGYLAQCEGKRIRRGYRRKMCQQQSLASYISIVLHLLLRSQSKHSFINRILELDNDTQIHLMEQLKTVQVAISNIVDMKEILGMMQQLQDQNELLRQSLKQVHANNSKLMQLAAQTQQEQERTAMECHRYASEKFNVFQELEIWSMRDYVDIFNHLKRENQELINQLQTLQGQYTANLENNQQLKRTVLEDRNVIAYLQDQIIKVKAAYVRTKQSYFDFGQEHGTNGWSGIKSRQSSNVLQENRNIANYGKFAVSFETECSMVTNNTLSELENKEMCKQNLQMTEELEKAHAKMAKLEEYVGQLEKDNIWLRKRYEKDQINLANIKREQTMLLASAALRIRF